jgi:hypothetical protein
VNALEQVALIIGIFFIVGVVVGFLAVMAIPSFLTFRQPQERPSPIDTTERLDIGPPVNGPGWPGGFHSTEPDDRDDPPDDPPDGPWWRDAG